MPAAFSRLPILLTILMLSTVTGCGKKNPVAEITAAQSGIQIRETTSDAADLPELHWNQWRGGSIDGLVEDRELATTWDESQNVVWKADVPGRGHGSPIVVGDAVYLATAIKEKQQ
ncbi:MAG: serine/threonine protein kinase, partial [Pirellulaceae bacterium]